jgi:transcription elongation GreA/GreB family factor
MDFKEKLRLLMKSEEWEELLEQACSLYDNGNEDRYIIRMITHAYEELGKEKEALPFWELLAREEHHSEEYSRKLIAYHKRNGNADAWLAWSKKLLSHALRRKEYDPVEDIWMQLVEAGMLEHQFALAVTERLITQEQAERAYTLLDILLLSLEQAPERALAVAKRMLELDPENRALRKRVEDIYRQLFSSCSETEQFLEKANIRKSKDVHAATAYFERLVTLCPGKYVAHKSWGVGMVRSVDLLFGKVFIDFPEHPDHGIEIDRALDMLEPRSEGDFEVRKVVDPSGLKKLKQEKPAELIKLLLNEKEHLPQKRVKTLLEGIVASDEWSSFLERVKKEAKATGMRLTRRGGSYLFSLQSPDDETRPSLEGVASLKNEAKRIQALISLAREELTPEDRREWVRLADELKGNNRTSPGQRTALLFARRELTGEEKYTRDALAELAEGMDVEDTVSLIENLQKRKHRIELFEFLAREDPVLTREVFHRTADDTLRGHALRMLEKETEASELLAEMLAHPFNHPLCLLYCIEKVMKEMEQSADMEKPIIVLETLMEFMKEEEVSQKVRTRAKTIFNKYGFDLYRWMLETASREETGVLLDMIKKHPFIESTEKSTFEKLAESRHPSLREKPKETFFYATKKAIQEKQRELDHLVKVAVPENSEEIGRAARQGDLSENFDYIAAKEKQRKLIDRVSLLKKELSRVQPIENVAFREGEATVGAQITVKSEATGAERDITILGPWDAIPDENIISHTSPFAQKIIGKKVGETFFDSFHSESLKILKVSKYIPDQ